MPWFKVDCGWWLTDWIIPLSSESQLCWLRMIEYTKEKGSRGSVKAISPSVAARIWMVGEESVRKLIEAAQTSGAIIVADGEWTLTGWDQYQSDPTAAERQANSRAKKAKQVQSVTASNDVSRDVTVTNGDNRESRLEERRGEESKVDNNPPPPKGGDADDDILPKPNDRTWVTVYKELKALLPEPYHAALKDWCVYASQRRPKFQPWAEITVRTNAKRWKDWTAQRLADAIEHTIASSWQGIKEPERPRQRHTSSSGLTAEQAGAINRGEGLIDRGSPIMRRQPE